MAPPARTPGVITRRLGAGWIACLVITALGTSVLIGWVGAPKHSIFDWLLAATVGTAVGTVLLAGFTGALAWTTSGDVQATWELVEDARRRRQDEDIPRVVQRDASYAADELEVELVNVGRGPALQVQVTITYSDGQQHRQWKHTIPVIMPGESLTNLLPTPFPPPLGLTPPEIDPTGFKLSGHCTDRDQAGVYLLVTD